MRRAPALLLCLALATPAGAQADTLVVDPVVDGALTVAPFSVWLALFLGEEHQVVQDPAQPPKPTGIDRFSPFRLNPTAATFTDVGLYGSLAVGAGLAAWDGAGEDGVASRLTLYSEAVFITGALTELTKYAVRRPRPYTWDHREGEVDDDLSFFSGHTSFTATAAFFTARSFDLTADLSPGARLGLYGGASLLTAAVAGGRVVAGKHFISDVWVGACVGAAVGVLVPELHRASRQGPVAERGLRASVVMMPEGGEGGEGGEDATDTGEEGTEEDAGPRPTFPLFSVGGNF